MLYNFPNENFYKSNVNENTAKKSFDFLETIMDKFTHKTWKCDIRTSYSITENILNYPELLSLKMNILGHIDTYMRLRNSFFNGYIDNSWVNVYEKNFYQEPHVHSSPTRKFICGVLYLTENNSPIHIIPHFNHENEFEIVPSFADILLFHDDVPHSVVANKNDGLRVSLAFNFQLCARQLDFVKEHSN
tara:strand:+ start:9249 stop:9815 length:567 start_codon:yes stop_codon:yes gene_type:complete